MNLPQRIAALPGRLPAKFEDASPGHRFLLYLRYWDAITFGAYKDVRANTDGLTPLQKREQRAKLDAEKKAPLGEVCPLGPSAIELVKGLRNRQKALIENYGRQGYRQAAESTAPFASGLGNEHPIENGFSFLTPYGLPYLAGSGVKGVLRRAAEELALARPESGWTWLDIWWLFGFEGAAGSLWEGHTEFGGAFAHDVPTLAAREDLVDFIKTAIPDKKESARFLDSKEDRRGTFLNLLLQDDNFRQSIHTRGALDFWDVFPSPHGNKLAVEIMTPHHTNYFQNGGTPHDAEPPVPVSFLAVPAKSAFDFHVVCHETRLPAHLRESWRQQLDSAFVHAFEWLGFGAKTSVGYGAMGPQAVTPQRPAHPNAGRYAPNAGAAETVWDKAQIKFNARNGALTAVGPNNAQANAIAPQGAELLGRLPPAIQQNVRQGGFVRLTATVRGSDLIGVAESA